MLPLAGVTSAAPAAISAASDVQAKARTAANEFEAVFINAMLQPMFSAVKGDGPFGGGPGSDIWKSLLTDEYAKAFAKNGGIGIADHVYRSLLAAQEGRSA